MIAQCIGPESRLTQERYSTIFLQSTLDSQAFSHDHSDVSLVPCGKSSLVFFSNFVREQSSAYICFGSGGDLAFDQTSHGESSFGDESHRRMSPDRRQKGRPSPVTWEKASVSGRLAATETTTDAPFFFFFNRVLIKHTTTTPPDHHSTREQSDISS